MAEKRLIVQIGKKNFYFKIVDKIPFFFYEIYVIEPMNSKITKPLKDFLGNQQIKVKVNKTRIAYLYFRNGNFLLSPFKEISKKQTVVSIYDKDKLIAKLFVWKYTINDKLGKKITILHSPELKTLPNKVYTLYLEGEKKRGIKKGEFIRC